MSDQEQQQQQQEKPSTTTPTTTEEEKQTGPQKPSQEQRRYQANALGNLVQQTVISNLPAGQRPIPEWKRKALEKEAIARGETIAATENDGLRPDANAGEGAVYKPPHERLAPIPLVSQQAQERSAFPGDFWFHKEIENLISKHRKKVQARPDGTDEDAFWDRSGKPGKGVIASYCVDAWPIIRNAVRGRRGYFDDNNPDDQNNTTAADGTNAFGRNPNNTTTATVAADVNNQSNTNNSTSQHQQEQEQLQQQELEEEKRLGAVPVPTLYSDDDEDQ